MYLAISILLSYLCNAQIPYAQTRSVSSDQILQKDENGDCYVPPFCHLDITKCNIPKIPINDFTFSDFHDKYYMPQQPVIIQFCPDKSIHCDLSPVIDTSSDLFEWHNIASLLMNKEDYQFMINTNKNGTIEDRMWQDFIQLNYHYRTNETEEKAHKQVYKAILGPSFVHDIDIFSDLLGFLSTSDVNPLISNKWVIFGPAGSGIHLHFDYYWSSAWNMPVTGSKYWVLAEFNDMRRIWNDSYTFPRILKQENRSHIDFFNELYINGFLEREIKRINRRHKPLQCLQEKGDFMYLPSLYFHATVNIERTISLSQNTIMKRDYRKGFHLMSGVTPAVENAYAYIRNNINETMALCVALNNYDSGLFENSVCATKRFLDKLDREIVNGSQVFLNACIYARNHAQYSDFR